MNRILILLFVLSVLSGCNDYCREIEFIESVDEESCLVSVPDTSSFVSKSDAWDIASYYDNKNNISRALPRTVSSIECVRDSIGNPLIYVANYNDDKGFLIISATKEYFPILAESETGHFDFMNIPMGHPVGLWLNEQKFKIENASSLTEDLRKSIANQWMDYNKKEPIRPSARSGYIEKPEVFYDSLRKWTQDPNIDVYIFEDYMRTPEYANLDEETKERMQAGMNMYGNSNYGPVESSSVIIRRKIIDYFENKLIKTQWTQGSPYNDLVPNGYPIGCTTIAAGQIMKYHEKPVRINWSDIPDVGVTNTTKEFLYSLATNIGVEFEEDGSGAKISQVMDCLQSRYDYNVTKRNHNEDDVYRDVYDGYPVYMTGKNKSFLGIVSWKGHAWVCDGTSWSTTVEELRVMTLEYRPTTYSTPSLMVEAYKEIKPKTYTPRRFHFNWGWGGSCDGYYDDSNIKLTLGNGEDREYKHARENLYIRPRR